MTTEHACTEHTPSATCYRRHACHCPECDRDFKRRKKLSRNGLVRMVDAEPVRQHVQTLQARGYTTSGIATAAGVGNQLIEYLLTTARKVHSRTAAAILAVNHPAGLVDATGTRRRLQALAAIGWTFAQMADHLGYNDATTVHHWTRSTRVTQSTAAAAAELYDAAWDKPQPPSLAADRSRRTAARKGWPPPLAWDDDEIDDPNARPHLGEGHNVWGSPLENVEWLAEAGEKLPGIARQLGKTEDSIKTLLWRHGRTSLLTKITPDLNPIRGDNTTKGRAA